jgi:hypothetical protein
MTTHEPLTYYCDAARHLVCVPYATRNLHRMALALGIGRWWFHGDGTYAHYDIPLSRVADVSAKCVVVRQRDILAIAKGTYRAAPAPPEAT